MKRRNFDHQEPGRGCTLQQLPRIDLPLDEFLLTAVNRTGNSDRLEIPINLKRDFRPAWPKINKMII